MKQLKTRTLTCVFISVLAMILLMTEVAAAGPLSSGVWKLIASQNYQPNSNALNAVAAIATNNVWSVGSYDPVGSNIAQTLVEQWDGMTWNIVASPNAGIYDNVLNGIGVVSASDIWAVGYFSIQFSGPHKTLIEHWDGTAWNIVPSPNVGNKDNQLTGIAVISANDIWTVGNYSKTIHGITFSQTLTEHWNGTSWSVSASPGLKQEDNFLNGVTAISTNDVWAVGDYDVANNQTLIEHWNGTNWSIVPSPNPGKGFPANNVLGGVAAVSTSDVWAIGSDFNKKGTQQTMTLHWDGASWTTVTSPNTGTNSNTLLGLAIVSSSDVWAVGHYYNTTLKLDQTLIEQWNGASWSVVTSPNVTGYGAGNNDLAGVASVAGSGQAWAVGNYNDGLGPKTLTEFYG